MIQIPLQSVPSQSLSIQLNNNSYDIVIRACNSGTAQIMAVDITLNNEIVVIGQRIVAGTPVIPYRELTEYAGNFFLLTENGDLPDYNEFQVSQYLVFGTQEELDAST